MQKFVALYGGSFNPSTEAHLAVGHAALASLNVDEVWYLVCPQNPFKPKEGMAPFDHRVAMARLNVEDTPKLVVQDIEGQYARNKPNGVIETVETLQLLAVDFPQHRFVWTIGADNFADLHTWKNPQYITDNYPIAVVTRDKYTDAALKSPSAQKMPRLDKAQDLRTTNGWFLLNVNASGIAASLCREELEKGTIPAAMRPGVAQYALANRIYVPH
ncbi:MAG: nicotinate (nicotinamide) nucleotide adenylyltransferase [Alphaproteobacteria bacterium]